MKPLSTSRPLIWRRKSAAMYGVIQTAGKRAGELEKLICKIYEDNALGKLPDARYKALDAQYAKEQDALEIEIAELEKAARTPRRKLKSTSSF